VALTFAGGQDWPRALRDDASADLRAGLRLRGIDVCDADSPAQTKPVALLELRISAAERVRVSIDVRDAITNKRVLREVDLHSVAPDARALLLAQAADELLRASWVELAVADAPAPALAPPLAVQHIVEEQVRAPAALRPVIGARAAFEHYTGGQNLFGGDAFLDVWLTRRLGASFGLGLRGGLVVHAMDGSVDTRALLLAGDVFATLWPAEMRYNLAVSFGLQISDMVVSGRPAESERAQQLSALAVMMRVGLSGYWQVTDSLRLSLSLAPGVSLRSVAARDAGEVVTSSSGLALQALLGVGGAL
jgi:hypothetical protein